MKYFVLVSIKISLWLIVCMTLTFFTLNVPLSSAQAPCTPIFGGGLQQDNKTPYCVENEQTAQAVSNTSEPTPSESGFTTPNSGLTKGGFAVQPAPSVNRQPSTGPELLGLAVLLPAAIGGVLLRKSSLRK